VTQVPVMMFTDLYPPTRRHPRAPLARRSMLGHRLARRPRSSSSRVGRARYVTGKEPVTPCRRTTSTSSPGKNTPRRVPRRTSTPDAIHREAPVDLECDRPLLAEDPSAWQMPPTVSRLGRAAVSSPTKGLPKNLPCNDFGRAPGRTQDGAHSALPCKTDRLQSGRRQNDVKAAFAGNGLIHPRRRIGRDGSESSPFLGSCSHLYLSSNYYLRCPCRSYRFAE